MEQHSVEFYPQSHVLAGYRNPKLILHVALLVLTAFGFAATDSNAAELKWQRARRPAARTAAKQKSQFQPRRHDRAVQPVAFEEDGESGPRLTSGSEGQATLRSIVVDRDAEPQTIRSAQLPFGDGSTQPATPDADLDLDDVLRAPFGELPEQEPEMDDLDLETPPQIEEPGLPPQDNNMRQPFDRAPQTFQPFSPRQTGPVGETDRDRQPPSEFDPAIAPPADRDESCEKSLTALKAKTIGTLSVSIAVDGTAGSDYPFECSIDNGTWHAGRCWPQTTYLWKASALCHKPLYFEDEQLERYGHSWPPCVQPFVSGAHFFCTLPVLPYCMGVEPPMECIYALGHYRPGNCAPYMCDPIPISPRGALFQAGAVVGTAAILP